MRWIFFSRCSPFEHYLALVEVGDTNLLLAAFLLPPDPDGLGADGRNDRLVHTLPPLLHVNGLAAAEPALFVEEFAVLDAGLPYHARRARGRRMA